MKTIPQLTDLIKENNILLGNCILPKNKLGYYQHSSRGFYIILNDCPELYCDDKLYKCVLAHELGHYYTSIGVNEPLSTNTYTCDIRILKEENKADKWAVNYLIDTDLLIEYLKNNTLAIVEDLIDYFQVTENYIVKKLKLMAVEKNYWHLKDNQYLCLSNLPSIFIATIFDSDRIEFLD